MNMHIHDWDWWAGWSQCFSWLAEMSEDPSPAGIVKPHLPRRFSPDWPIRTWPRPWHYFHRESKILHREQRQNTFERKCFHTDSRKYVFESKKKSIEIFILRNNFKNFKFLFIYVVWENAFSQNFFFSFKYYYSLLLVWKFFSQIYFFSHKMLSAISVITFSQKLSFFSQIICFLAYYKDTNLTPWAYSSLYHTTAYLKIIEVIFI